MWHLKKINKKNKKQSTKVLNPGHRLVVAEGGLWWGWEVGEGGQMVQTSNYRKVTHGIIMCSMEL